MNSVSRRLMIRGSIGLAATGALARPYIANAAAATAVVWQVQGFVPEEDAAFRKTVADYEKASGNKIDLSVMPFQALNQKAISAITSGEVPDLIFHDAPATILPQNAWNDKLVDVSDVVEEYRSRLSETALLNSSFYNGTTKQRAFYLAPVKQATSPFHIWGDLVTKAGFKLSDAPDTWDAFWSFFKPVQKELRAKGMRKMYAMGMQITTVGPNDGNGLFAYFMVANGGQDIRHQGRQAAHRRSEGARGGDQVGRVHDQLLQGRLHPAGGADLERRRRQQRLSREAVRDGSRWHAVDRTRDDQEQEGVLRGGGGDGPAEPQRRHYDALLPRRRRRLHPEGREERRGVQGFHEVLHAAAGDEREPEEWPGSMGAGHTANREGRSMVAGQQRGPAPAPYVHEAVLGPTIPAYNGFNPAWGQVSAEQLWGNCHADVIKNGMTPAAAVDKAFKRAEAIFAKFTFG